jgi:hypothetical protein
VLISLLRILALLLSEHGVRLALLLTHSVWLHSSWGAALALLLADFSSQWVGVAEDLLDLASH